MSQSTTEPKTFWACLNRPTLTLLALQLMSGMILGPHLTFFPVYLNDLGYSTLLIANLTAAKQVAGLVSSLIGGGLSDSIGRKRTLLLGNLGHMVASLAFLIISPGWIGVFWVVGGLGMGLHTLGAQSYLMDTAAPKFLGLTSAIFNWGYTLGGVLSSPVAGYLLDGWDFKVMGIGLVGFAACTLAVNLFILPRSPALREKPAFSLKGAFGYSDIALRPTVIALAVLRFLPTFYYAILLLLVPILLDAAGASKITIAWYATVSWTAASLSQAFVGHTADRWGSKSTTALTFGVLFISSLGLGFWHASLWTVFSFGSLGISAAWSLSTLLPSLVAEAAAPEERGRILGFIHLWWNLGMIVGSIVGGALFEVRRGLPFWVAGVGVLGAVGVLRWFYRRVKEGR
jgi:MFS family permease